MSRSYKNLMGHKKGFNPNEITKQQKWTQISLKSAEGRVKGSRHVHIALRITRYEARHPKSVMAKFSR